MYDFRSQAHEVLDKAMNETHPVRRQAHLRFLSKMVTFNDAVRAYENMLAHPEQFERLPRALRVAHEDDRLR